MVLANMSKENRSDWVRTRQCTPIHIVVLDMDTMLSPLPLIVAHRSAPHALSPRPKTMLPSFLVNVGGRFANISAILCSAKEVLPQHSYRREGYRI